MKKQIDKIKEILKSSSVDQLRAHWIISKTEDFFTGAVMRDLIMIELERRDPVKFEKWLEDPYDDFSIFEK